MSLAEKYIRNLQAGTVWVNTYNLIPVNMPFGGYK
jgi:acyl-CoA reductase-like NAD-dependent aldehyde dehydrogenase